MKKFILFSVSAAAIIFSSFTAGTPAFEGKIVYSIDVNSNDMPPEAKAMMAGSEYITYIKEMKTRSEMNMGMQNTISIYDGSTKTSVSLIDMMGNKYMIKSDASKKDEKQPDAKVNVTGETKTIAGYVCKKAEITSKDKDGNTQTANIWFTEEIPNRMNVADKRYAKFRDITGMPLEYEMQGQRGMTMKMTATSVSKESVSDDKFLIPSGYKETTIEDMQKEMMQMYQGGGQH
jgi:hypothetical protein